MAPQARTASDDVVTPNASSKLRGSNRTKDGMKMARMKAIAVVAGSSRSHKRMRARVAGAASRAPRETRLADNDTSADVRTFTLTNHANARVAP